jgi:hypothetical protein
VDDRRDGQCRHRSNETGGRIAELDPKPAAIVPWTCARSDAEHGRHDVLDVVIKTFVPQRQRVARRDRADIVGQLIRLRHARAIDQHWQHQDGPLQSCTHLRAHVVAGLSDAHAAAVGCEPRLANEHQHGIAALDLRHQLAVEDLAARDRAHVKEHVGFRQQLTQAVIDPPGSRCGVLTPIADEHALCHDRSRQLERPSVASTPDFSRCCRPVSLLSTTRTAVPSLANS